MPREAYTCPRWDCPRSSLAKRSRGESQLAPRLLKLSLASFFSSGSCRRPFTSSVYLVSSRIGSYIILYKRTSCFRKHVRQNDLKLLSTLFTRVNAICETIRDVQTFCRGISLMADDKRAPSVGDRQQDNIAGYPTVLM